MKVEDDRADSSLSDVRTSSTSYSERASSTERGKPDQITDSGSIGGMKRVDFSLAMSYVR